MNALLFFLIYWAIGCFYMWDTFFGPLPPDEDDTDEDRQEVKDLVAQRDAIFKSNPAIIIAMFLLLSVIWPVIMVNVYIESRK